jgi:hypothetical protein
LDPHLLKARFFSSEVPKMDLNQDGASLEAAVFLPDLWIILDLDFFGTAF